MAKVTQPLFSQSASGNVARRLTFSAQRGATVARSMSHMASRATGHQPSAGQLAQRAAYRDAVAWWNALPPLDRAAYQPAADAARISVYAAAIGDRLRNPPPAGIPWDGGTTVWDGGATIWTD